MKSESKKELRQDSFYCTSQVHPLWWNSAVSHVPRSSHYKNLNTNLDSSTQKGQPVKQLGHQLKDQDSSLTQSSSQSHHGMPGYKETNEQRIVATAKSALSHGTEFLFPTAQVDYNQSVVRIPYTYADPYFAGLVTAYGPQIHSQLYGVQAARVPLPLDLAAEPIYVNAKQYRGILRRRESRAKLEAQNKLVRARKQPYLHESRHLHAMKRVRGSGGRFLNTKEVQDSTVAPSTHEQNATSSALQRFGGESLSESEVQSENGNPTSCSDLTSLSNNGEDIFSQAQPGNPAVHSHVGSALEDGGSVMLYRSEHRVLHHSATGGRMIGYGL